MLIVKAPITEVPCSEQFVAASLGNSAIAPSELGQEAAFEVDRAFIEWTFAARAEKDGVVFGTHLGRLVASTRRGRVERVDNLR